MAPPLNYTLVNIKDWCKSSFEVVNHINTLKAGAGLSEDAIREGYIRFKKEKDGSELAAIAAKHGLAAPALQTFVDGILQRLMLDCDALSALMADLIPLLNKRGRARNFRAERV